MSKDVLNRSKLSVEEDRIMIKVLTCKQYTPGKVYKGLNWVDKHFSDRVKFVTVIVLLAHVACICLPGYSTTNVLEEIAKLLCDFIVCYVLVWVLIPSEVVKYYIGWIWK